MGGDTIEKSGKRISLRLCKVFKDYVNSYYREKDTISKSEIKNGVFG
jgi:hypothetical protein